MRYGLAFFSTITLALLSASAHAWWDEGHMQIAAVAYKRLTPAARMKADALIQLNPEYENWIAGVAPANVAQYAFVRAATWADDIKQAGSGYINDGDIPTGLDAARNIGYADLFMHKYWHYKDIGFSTDGTPVQEPASVNAATQIKLLSAALSPASGLSDDIRSYDLVWLLHLVGDVHQPLHATSRFSQAHPNGDQGGNLEKVAPATGETINLHAYWDRLLGSYSTPAGAIRDALSDPHTKLPPPDRNLAAESDPDRWLYESQVLAENFVYAAPVTAGDPPYELDRTYETNARNIARQQAALAGARLANLINDALK